MKRLALAAVLLFAASAAAKSSREYPYGYDPTWAALVRFLRVDENLKLVEKDAANGYIVFELLDNKKTYNGAAELMKVDGGTRVVVRIGDRPAYMEQGLLDRFADKLHDELGDPIQPSAPAPQPDAGPSSEKKP